MLYKCENEHFNGKVLLTVFQYSIRSSLQIVSFTAIFRVITQEEHCVTTLKTALKETSLQTDSPFIYESGIVTC